MKKILIPALLLCANFACEANIPRDTKVRMDTPSPFAKTTKGHQRTKPNAPQIPLPPLHRSTSSPSIMNKNELKLIAPKDIDLNAIRVFGIGTAPYVESNYFDPADRILTNKIRTQAKIETDFLRGIQMGKNNLRRRKKGELKK